MHFRIANWSSAIPRRLRKPFVLVHLIELIDQGFEGRARVL
jgi:hypothetical protein